MAFIWSELIIQIAAQQRLNQQSISDYHCGTALICCVRSQISLVSYVAGVA